MIVPGLPLNWCTVFVHGRPKVGDSVGHQVNPEIKVGEIEATRLDDLAKYDFFWLQMGFKLPKISKMPILSLSLATGTFNPTDATQKAAECCSIHQNPPLQNMRSFEKVVEGYMTHIPSHTYAGIYAPFIYRNAYADIPV